jgi:dTDP-4-dehydrorhamnose reductase
LKRYLILGASGLLGSKLLNFLPDSHGTFFGNISKGKANMSFLDVNNLEKFTLLLEMIKPNVVINCTGLTNVDKCENFPEKSWRLNTWLPLQIAKMCSVRSVKYIHISTDHFMNLSGTKLKENDYLVPINHYGYSKLSSELFIHSMARHSMIVRSNFFHFNMHSPRTFLDHLIAGVKNETVFKSFSDVLFTPISTFQLATYIQKLVEIDFAGVINISSTEVLSKYDFHNAILKEMNIHSERHLPVLLDSVKLGARRPRFMALDNNLLQKTLGVTIPSIYDMIKTELQLSK